MKTKIVRTMLALACSVSLLMAQAKQPKPKSQKEIDALTAVQNATTPDAKIEAIENVLTKFADTEFKPVLLQMASAVEQEKGDWDKMVVYAERTLDANPKDYVAMLMLADYYSSRTREHDLDKEEKLTRADKYSNDALAALKTADKLRPDITDEQWTSLRKDFISQAHAALGATAALRKKYDVAMVEYKTAVDGAGTPSGEMMVRAASMYTDAHKYDESIALLDRTIALPDVHPTTKQVAAQEKTRAQRLKAAGGSGAAPAAAVPQVEIKK